MKKMILAIFVSIYSLCCFATAMSPERSRCLALQTVAKDHKEWKDSFSAFLVSDEFTPEDKVGPLSLSLAKLTQRLETVREQGQVKVNQELIDVPRKFLKEFEVGRVDDDVAYKMMVTGLNKLEDEIDDALLRAHLKSETCMVFSNDKSSGRDHSGQGSGVK